ncbi:MAG: SsrA-binding protein SmpB [Nitrospirota bacterium]
MKIVCQNRKAYHDYNIEETVEAAIQLLGTEVKSLREGKANLRDSYVIIKDSEVYLLNCHISPYTHGNIMNHDPLRTRKLLLHRREIERLRGKAQQKGYTLIPLKIYFKGPYAKVEIGLATGKRLYEKREAIREREAKKAIERALKSKGQGGLRLRVAIYAIIK